MQVVIDEEEDLIDDEEGAQRPALDAAALEAEVAGMVRGFVGADVDTSAPLAAQGLDSLAAMELRQKLQVASLDLLFWCSPSSKTHVQVCSTRSVQCTGWRGPG